MDSNTSVTLERLIVCPDCGQSGNWSEDASNDASGEESSGESHHRLKCGQCDFDVSIVRGIPRFVQQQHLASFSRQWNTWEVAHDDEDRATFQAKTGLSLDQIDGKLLLDAGCGGGRYCKVAAEAGASIVGADHSTAVEKASELCSHLPEVHLLQADLKRLPFAEGTFDAAFSIGVMHHDSDTRAVFDAVAKMVKPGGTLSVWLYRQNQWWQEGINNFLRRRTVRMPPERLERWSKLGATLGAIPIVNRTLNKVINFSAHPSRENRICDTFDWYAPKYQHHHTIAELTSWYEAAGYEELTVLPPEKTGRFYRWCYERNLLIGSGVNMIGRRSAP